MASTKIEWADKVWNPVTGCSSISEGCAHCYAERMAKRLAGRFGYPRDNPFSVTLHPSRIDEPLHWRKPQRIFVASMGDLFHDRVPSPFLDDIFATMHSLQRHLFILLTKRPQQMQDYCTSLVESYWPFPNVILMTTCENQRRADERIPILLQTPAAVRGVSLEPMLGPINLKKVLAQVPHGFDIPNSERERMDVLSGWKMLPMSREVFPCEPSIDWVILGSETGPGARPMQLDWARRVRDNCQEAGVPFFFKKDSQGNHELDGQVWEQFPEVKPPCTW